MSNTRPFVCVTNLGCRVNRVESDRITTELSERGFVMVDESEADCIVINTCAVTGEAEAKTRKAVRHAVNLEQKPWVVVTGCVVNLHPSELTDLSDRVIAQPLKVEVPQTVENLLGVPAEIFQHDDEDLSHLLGRHRLGIKVQDGCDNRCTYCIVWKARGASRSVAPDIVLEQVKQAVNAGIHEVVLTGVNLGRYDSATSEDRHVELDELVQMILDETSIKRVRLSSIEPQDVTERLVDVVSQSNGRVAAFFHMPLQSGCDATLERMGRLYTTEDYDNTCKMIRSKIPLAAISCDLIVGFPGETDEEFEASFEFCKHIGFSRMHVFRYSKRPGTIAATAPDQVDPQVSAARSQRLRAEAERMAKEDAAAHVGLTESATIEAEKYATLGCFHHVLVEGAQHLVGELVPINLERIDETGRLCGTVAFN